MTEDELIEEAAKAMLIVDYPGATWDQTVVSVKNAWLDMARAALAVFDRARQDDWEYAPAFEEEPDVALALISREIAQREVDGWNQARRRTIAREGRDIGKSILVRRHPATDWEPVLDTEGSEQAEKDVAKHLATEHPEPPSDAEMWRTQCKVARQQCIEWELAFSAAEAKLARIADALRADERSSVRVAMALAILNDKEADRG